MSFFLNGYPVLQAYGLSRISLHREATADDHIGPVHVLEISALKKNIPCSLDLFYRYKVSISKLLSIVCDFVF